MNECKYCDNECSDEVEHCDECEDNMTPVNGSTASPCSLCDMGHPINDEGYHYPTQSVGMIPYTKCSKENAETILPEKSQ